jgi:predicted permease
MRDWTAYAVSFHDWMVTNARPALLILLAAVGLVLLIACTNLASLMLARAAARDREIAIRTALGANRWALVRQFLTETVLLGLIGGSLGLLLAMWGIDVFERLMPATLHVPDSNAYLNRPKVAIDAIVLGFTLLISLVTGLLFGVAPAFAAARSDANESLKEGGRNSGSSRSSRVRGLLVISEVALALVLLVCAGLTIKSFWNIQQVKPGFAATNVLIMDTELPTDSKYRSPIEQALLFKRVLENMSNIPGVSAIGMTCSLPMDEQNHRNEFKIAGRPLPPSGQLLPTDFRAISEGYFTAMGIPLKRGRTFDAHDDQDRPKVAIIDETLAARYWPAGVEGAQDPIGQHLEFGKTSVEIVGIVGAVKNSGLDRNPEPTIYVPYLQHPESRMTFVLRTPQPLATVRAAKNALYAVDKDQPVYNVRTMQDILAGSLSTSRLTLTLLLAFAVVAMALASIGIYGVMSYAVAQRTTEIGIRMALGAGARSVLSLVIGQGMRLAIIGVLAGLIGSYVASRLIASLLFAVSPTDVVIFGSTAALLSGVALIACYLPARRAAKTDPAVCLRCQ